MDVCSPFVIRVNRMDTRCLSSERTENRILTTTLIQNSCLSWSRQIQIERTKFFLKRYRKTKKIEKRHGSVGRRFLSTYVIQRARDARQFVGVR